MYDLRYPAGGDAGNAADAQLSLNLMVDVERRLAQPVLLVRELPHIGKQPCAVVGQCHAAVDAGEELYAQFLLEPRHHLADAGLRIVQCLGGL